LLIIISDYQYLLTNMQDFLLFYFYTIFKFPSSSGLLGVAIKLKEQDRSASSTTLLYILHTL